MVLDMYVWIGLNIFKWVVNKDAISCIRNSNTVCNIVIYQIVFALLRFQRVMSTKLIAEIDVLQEFVFQENLPDSQIHEPTLIHNQDIGKCYSITNQILNISQSRFSPENNTFICAQPGYFPLFTLKPSSSEKKEEEKQQKKDEEDKSQKDEEEEETPIDPDDQQQDETDETNETDESDDTDSEQEEQQQQQQKHQGKKIFPKRVPLQNKTENTYLLYFSAFVTFFLLLLILVRICSYFCRRKQPSLSTLNQQSHHQPNITVQESTLSDQAPRTEQAKTKYQSSLEQLTFKQKNSEGDLEKEGMV